MAEHDLVIRGGTIYDGSGGTPYTGDVAVDGQMITELGPAGSLHGKAEIDAGGLAVPMSSLLTEWLPRPFFRGRTYRPNPLDLTQGA